MSAQQQQQRSSGGANANAKSEDNFFSSALTSVLNLFGTTPPPAANAQTQKKPKPAASQSGGPFPSAAAISGGGSKFGTANSAGTGSGATSPVASPLMRATSPASPARATSASVSSAAPAPAGVERAVSADITPFKIGTPPAPGAVIANNTGLAPYTGTGATAADTTNSAAATSNSAADSAAANTATAAPAVVPIAVVPEDTRSAYEKRLDALNAALAEPVIPRKVITAFVFQYGVPDRPGRRALLWKLTWGYLPYNQSQWEPELKRNRSQYAQFVHELTANPYSKLTQSNTDPLGAIGMSSAASTATAAAPAASAGSSAAASSSSSSSSSSVTSGLKTVPAVTRMRVNPLDDPLSPNPNTEWTQFFKDNEIREEIDKDVKRTYSTFHFFNQRVVPVAEPAPQPKPGATVSSAAGGGASASGSGAAAAAAPKSLFDKPEPAANRGVNQPLPQPKQKNEERHHDVLSRILFLFAKLNPGIRYVQGMNELLAPIYYVFAKDTEPKLNDNAEADAFFCFTLVMAEFRDRFIKTLDSSASGIIAVVRELNELLMRVDRPLWQHLENGGVDPRFYSFRWLTLMLSQEFELPDVLRLWDSLFADPQRFSFLNYCCCAMLVNVRTELLAGDFAANLQLLQRYPQIDIQIILSKAHQLRELKNLPAHNEILHPTKSAPPNANATAASAPLSPVGNSGGSLLDIATPQLASERKRVAAEKEKMEKMKKIQKKTNARAAAATTAQSASVEPTATTAPTTDAAAGTTTAAAEPAPAAASASADAAPLS